MPLEVVEPVRLLPSELERYAPIPTPRTRGALAVVRGSRCGVADKGRATPLEPAKDSARVTKRPSGQNPPAPVFEKSTLDREVAPYRAMLRQVARRILRCPEQAEDAVQEAMIRLWERPDRPPELRGWLVRTVIHRSLHRRRSEVRRRRWEDEAAVAISITCPLCDPEEEFAQLEFLEVLAAAVSSLAENQREVIALRSQGLDYGEIAEALSLPIGTVRSRLSRARSALREQLEIVEL